MELSKIFEYQGIELGEDATFEDYKSSFDAKYLTKDNALQDESIRNHWAGETTSKFARELTRTAKENDIELTPEEKVEREKYRKMYLEQFKQQVRQKLDSIEIVDEKKLI